MHFPLHFCVSKYAWFMRTSSGSTWFWLILCSHVYVTNRSFQQQGKPLHCKSLLHLKTWPSDLRGCLCLINRVFCCRMKTKQSRWATGYHNVVFFVQAQVANYCQCSLYWEPYFCQEYRLSERHYENKDSVMLLLPPAPFLFLPHTS